MKLARRITSLVLTLVILMTLALTGAWTPHVHAEEITALEDLQIVHVNPLYADTITEADLAKPDHSKLYADDTDGEYYYDAGSAADLIRDDLVARDTTIVVDAYCAYTGDDTVNANAKQLVHDILGYAMAHTGNPVEGDYLLWQYAGFQAQMTNATHDGTNIRMTIIYTMTYHTSAAQEAEMDTAVNKLLGSLNVSGADDYTKLSAIYDYICSNITYDYDNLEDESYTLKHTAYAALINKTAVCQGYALLLYRLALELGVDCRLIAGDSSGEAHGWNIAQLNDLYYNLDSTWDAGSSEYQYFLVCPNNFSNHNRWDEYDTAAFHKAYPMAEYNYAVDCDHTYASAVTIAPTCTEKGEETYTCTKCGNSYAEVLPATGHKYDQSVVTAPTCTEKGYTTHTCSACGDSYQNTIVAATGHSYDAGVVTKEATCAEPGVKTFTCAACKDSYTEQIPMADHIYDKAEVTAPTCTEKGYTTHTCSACGDSYQDTFVDAAGHSYDAGAVTKEATCAEPGVKTFTCSVCKESYTEQIPMLDHVYDKTEVTAPNCSEQGYTTHTCSACGDSYQDTFVDATGHNYTDAKITTEPTCTETGVKTYTCSRCGGLLNEPVDALGHAHDDGKVTTEPTCTETGIKTHTCVRCGDTLTNIIDALGHTPNEGTVTLAPTCLEAGIMTYTCTVCQESYTEPVPATGHTYDEGTVTTKPTCTEEGVKTFVCTNGCGVSFTEAVPATGHNFEDGACAGCGIKAVVITTQPKTGYAKMGEVAKVTLAAEGEGLHYQWYIRNADQTKYHKSSVTGPTYSCRMSETSKDRRALCIITDQYGNKVQAKTVMIREAVSVVTEPKTTYARYGAVAKVTTEASGDGLTYQWYIRNADQTKYTKSAVTGPTYSCKMTDTSKDRRALCIITDQYGNKVQTKTVMIRMAATITGQPSSVTVKKGATAKATVEAAGDGLTYQWYIKGAGQDSFSKSSVTRASYSVTMSEKADGRQAYCVITDKYGKTARSNVITFSMK